MGDHLASLLVSHYEMASVFFVLIAISIGAVAIFDLGVFSRGGAQKRLASGDVRNSPILMLLCGLACGVSGLLWSAAGYQGFIWFAPTFSCAVAAFSLYRRISTVSKLVLKQRDMEANL